MLFLRKSGKAANGKKYPIIALTGTVWHTLAGEDLGSLWIALGTRIVFLLSYDVIPKSIFFCQFKESYKKVSFSLKEFPSAFP